MCTQEANCSPTMSRVRGGLEAHFIWVLTHLNIHLLPCFDHKVPRVCPRLFGCSYAAVSNKRNKENFVAT